MCIDAHGSAYANHPHEPHGSATAWPTLVGKQIWERSKKNVFFTPSLNENGCATVTNKAALPQHKKKHQNDVQVTEKSVRVEVIEESLLARCLNANIDRLENT